MSPEPGGTFWARLSRWSPTRGSAAVARSELPGAVLLMLYSGTIIHLGGGLIEWHLLVFVGMSALILYYDWLPIVVAAVTIAIHHILLDEFLPQAVFKDGQSHSVRLCCMRRLSSCTLLDVCSWLSVCAAAPQP